MASVETGSNPSFIYLFILLLFFKIYFKKKREREDFFFFFLFKVKGHIAKGDIQKVLKKD